MTIHLWIRKPNSVKLYCVLKKLRINRKGFLFSDSRCTLKIQTQNKELLRRTSNMLNHVYPVNSLWILPFCCSKIVCLFEHYIPNIWTDAFNCTTFWPISIFSLNPTSIPNPSPQFFSQPLSPENVPPNPSNRSVKVRIFIRNPSLLLPQSARKFTSSNLNFRLTSYRPHIFCTVMKVATTHIGLIAEMVTRLYRTIFTPPYSSMVGILSYGHPA